MREPTEKELELFTKQVESVAGAIKAVVQSDTDDGCKHNYTAEVIVTAIYKAADGNIEDVLHYFKHAQEAMDDVLQKIGQKVLSQIVLHERRN